MVAAEVLDHKLGMTASVDGKIIIFQLESGEVLHEVSGFVVATMIIILSMTGIVADPLRFLSNGNGRFGPQILC